MEVKIPDNGETVKGAGGKTKEPLKRRPLGYHPEQSSRAKHKAAEEIKCILKSSETTPF